MRALITGGSRGIGRAIARELHRRGAKLALLARDEEGLQHTAAELPGSVALCADLACTSELPLLVDRAADALEGLDVLVNCAGIVHYAPVGEVESASLSRQLSVNFVAPFLLSQHAALRMRAAGTAGCIVNVASTLGLRPAEQTAAYAATKAALISMTRSFALELGPHGIRVNAVAPGIVDTDMVRVLRPQGSGEPPGPKSVREQLMELAQLHPLGRLARPEEVAEAVGYLLEADFVTGSVLVVDGGLLLHR